MYLYIHICIRVYPISYPIHIYIYTTYLQIWYTCLICLTCLVPRVALAIGVLTSNRRGVGTNFGGVHVWCHCWAPLLGAIAGFHCWGAIAGVPLLGCHCWGAIAIVPLLGAIARKNWPKCYTVLRCTFLYIDNTQFGLCYLGLCWYNFWISQKGLKFHQEGGFLTNTWWNISPWLVAQWPSGCG